MKYVIYGINRVAKDFLYIFDQLNILYFIEEEKKFEQFMGKRVVSLAECLENRVSFDQIIICDFDKEEKKTRLVQEGLIYGKDFVYEEDFFGQLDEITIPSERKLAIWGTGVVAKEFYSYSKSRNVFCYIDTLKKEEIFYDIPVVKPEEIKYWQEYFIILAVAKDRELRISLEEKGLVEGVDYTDYQKIMGLPSTLLRKTIFDKSYYDLECHTMQNHLEIFYRGNTRCCCTTFVAQNLDNIFEKNVIDLWNSNIHKIMHLSTENKTYTFCNKSMCPLFVAKQKEKVRMDEIPYKMLTQKPEVLSLGYDTSCNLCCSTCRKELHFAKGEELNQVNQVTELIKKEYLEHCKFLILAGDGEVFASKAYREIYEAKECNPEYIRLLSNGTLFTPKNWENFIKNKTGKIMLTVSIDAATKETYENIRGNGNFEQLRKNMEFASSLRKEGKLDYFRLNFVVQRKNYREMIPFVQWGEELGVDEIFFTKILNWGTYSEEEFQQVSMMEQDGITPKEELKEVLNHPVLRESNIVDLGTIQYMHKIDEIDIVENYYKWELEKRGGKLFH